MENRVTSLGYIGGQDEDLGGYCEPLIVTDEGGREDYLLHRMGQHREIREGREIIINDHSKRKVPSKIELLADWTWINEHLMVKPKWEWEETNSTCGYNIPEQEFAKARSEAIGREK